MPAKTRRWGKKLLSIFTALSLSAAMFILPVAPSMTANAGTITNIITGRLEIPHFRGEILFAVVDHQIQINGTVFGRFSVTGPHEDKALQRPSVINFF